jgi:hypothetical protein
VSQSSLRSILILSSNLHLGLLSVLVPLDLSTRIFYALIFYSMLAAFPANLMLRNLNMLVMISGEDCKLRSSLLCSLPQTSVISSFLGIDSESLVGTAWRVLGLRLEEMPLDTEGDTIYTIISQGEPTSGGPPANNSSPYKTSSLIRNVTQGLRL